MSAKKASRSVQGSPAQRGFDKELAELEALAGLMKAGATPQVDTIEHLRRALAHRNNFIVSQSRQLVAEAELFALLPDVLAASTASSSTRPRPIRSAGQE